MVAEPELTIPNDRTPDHLLCLYEIAQENAHHHEVVMWTILSVTWGANILLLSSALGSQQPTVGLLRTIIPIAGIVLTVFAAHTWFVFRDMKNSSYEACQEIEGRDQFPVSIHLHRRIAKDYGSPKFTGYPIIISVLFVLAWGFNLFVALTPCFRQ